MTTQKVFETFATLLILFYAAQGDAQLINGDFEDGVSGFTSQYSYAPGYLHDGNFTVCPEPEAWHPFFVPTRDHTSGTGNMFVTGGLPPGNLYFWQQEISVLPMHQYKFSGWGSSAYRLNPAEFVVTINGEALGDSFTLPSTTGVWVTWTRTWQSGASTTADIRIFDVTLSGAGNDFYVDDLSFSLVPEPASMAIAFLALLGICFARRHGPAKTPASRPAQRAIFAGALIAIFLGACLPASATTPNSLIGYWPFNGNGSDASGGARPLTIYGNAGFAGGLFGQALDLHGTTSQYAGRPVDDSIFDFGLGDFTVQIWVNYNTVQREQNLIEKFQGQGGPGWTLTSLLGGGDLVGQAHFYAIEGQVALYSRTQLNVTPGVWQQFVARRTGTKFDLLYNGVIVDSRTNSQPVTDTTFPLLIGRRNAADGRDFSVNGRLDEAAIWNRALSNQEIAFLYNGGAGNPVSIPEPAGCALAALALLALRMTPRRSRPQSRDRWSRSVRND